jgi:hypothetical protein
VNRLYALCSLDRDTGCATKIVAVAGVDDAGGEAVSWIPLQTQASAPWRARLAAADGPLAETLAWWADNANRVTADVVDIPTPPGPADLGTSVESAVDDLLATGAA